MGQKPAPIPSAQVVQEVRDYRMDHEDRIVRELSEFLSIPNVASDTPNIQKNAEHLREMLEARGIETHLLPITGRGPVVFGKLVRQRPHAPSFSTRITMASQSIWRRGQTGHRSNRFCGANRLKPAGSEFHFRRIAR